MSTKKIWWPNSQDQLVKKTYQILPCDYVTYLDHNKIFNPSVNLLGPESTSQRRPSWSRHWFLGVSVPILPGKKLFYFYKSHNFGFFSSKKWKSSCRGVCECSNFPDRGICWSRQVTWFLKKVGFFTCWFGELGQDIVLSIPCFSFFTWQK